MKIAIVGSRSLDADIPESCIPDGVTKILSGGAIGIDTSARRFAREHGILIIEILPDYGLYGKTAPLKRNDIIVSLSDKVFIFWDGKSRGSGYIIRKCKEMGKPYTLYLYNGSDFILHEEYPAE